MGHIIAVAGKGGTGKTTIAALLVRLIKEKKLGSVLAVDADPNSNLGEVLGVEVKQTIGGVLDEIGANPDKIPVGMPKDRFIEYQVQTIVQEEEGFDIITMGKPEGAGCYCYVNNVLRNVMARLVKDYDYIIIDNEAGLEHLSRRTTRSADVLLVVSDSTVVGLRAAQRIAKIASDLNIKVNKSFLLLNQTSVSIENKKTASVNASYLGNIPQDEELLNLSINGSPVWGLKTDAKSLIALNNLGEKIWQKI